MKFMSIIICKFIEITKKIIINYIFEGVVGLEIVSAPVYFPKYLNFLIYNHKYNFIRVTKISRFLPNNYARPLYLYVLTHEKLFKRFGFLDSRF